MKFFTDPMLSTLDPEGIIKIVTNHIEKLKKPKEFWEKWYHVKVNDSATGLIRLSFEMTIENIDYQIRWHKELLEHLDEYIKSSKETEQIIKTIDFNKMTSCPIRMRRRRLCWIPCFVKR